MPHIKLPAGLPGISGPMAYRPETAKPLNELAEILLRGPSTMPSGERELIAAYVSSENDCWFCQSCHGSAAAWHMNKDYELVEQVKRDFRSAQIPEKLKSLINIAGKVQKGGKHVTQEDIDDAKNMGATDLEIHDTVLIAAAFCMYNRYVDGLATIAPQAAEAYYETGKRLAEVGYVNAVPAH